MKALKLVMYSLIFWCLPLMIHAQKLHFIVFATTIDRNIGAGNQASLQKLDSLISNIDKKSLIKEVVSYRYLNNGFTQPKLAQLLDSLRQYEIVADNDVVWFYFLGHGEQSLENKESIGDIYPSLIFKQDAASKRLETEVWRLSDIYQELKRLNARLTLCMAEACNSSSNNTTAFNFPETPQNNDLIDSSYNTACSIDLMSQKLNDLFLDAKGSAILSSSEMGQNSYVHTTNGGIFTNIFCQLISNYMPEKTNLMTWGALLQQLQNETQQLTKKIAKKNPQVKEQIPYYCELITHKESQIFVKTKEERLFFKDLFNEFLIASKIENKIAFEPHFDERFSAETIQKLHTDCPLSYYILKATIADRLSKNGSEAFIYYSVAQRLLNKKRLSKQDEHFKKQLFLLDKSYHMLGHFKYNNKTGDWLQEMCVKHQQDKSLNIEVNNIMKQIAKDSG